MRYTTIYSSPIGPIYLNSNGKYLTEINFKEPSHAKDSYILKSHNHKVFKSAIKWLDSYFSRSEPEFMPDYLLENLTPFRQIVINEMIKIPFGCVTTYGDLAKCIAKKTGQTQMSAQAIGGAVGWNPICIMIPCHRIIGKNGQLTGYRGGIDKKIKLLEHEGHIISNKNILVR